MRIQPDPDSDPDPKHCFLATCVLLWTVLVLPSFSRICINKKLFKKLNYLFKGCVILCSWPRTPSLFCYSTQKFSRELRIEENTDKPIVIFLPVEEAGGEGSVRPGAGQAHSPPGKLAWSRFNTKLWECIVR